MRTDALNGAERAAPVPFGLFRAVRLARFCASQIAPSVKRSENHSSTRQTRRPALQTRGGLGARGMGGARVIPLHSFEVGCRCSWFPEACAR